MRIVAISLAVLFLFFCHSSVDAKTYECKAADRIAKLGISPRSAVAVSGDNNRKECKFAVNGAKVSSPPQGLIFEAFNALLTNRRLFSNNWSNNHLAALLLSAGPDTEITAMSNILSNARNQIQLCINSLINNQNTRVVFPNSNVRGQCVVTRPNRNPIEFGSITFRFDEQDSIPVLLLFIRRGDLTNLLAIPRRQ